MIFPEILNAYKCKCNVIKFKVLANGFIQLNIIIH